ncbi:MAG: alpha/beta fold hydrolase [Pseudomonadota bacterium]
MTDRPAAVTLFLLPYAGGSFYAYNELIKQLGPGLTPLALDLPGRGRRLREPLLMSAEALAADLFGQMRPHLDRPYAIFGHSLGAILGYLAAGLARRDGLAEPRHLFVSARIAPEHPEPGCLHRLPEAEFIAQVVARYQGIPPAVLAEPELLALFGPILRADVAAAETYRHQPQHLTAPVTVLLGADDPSTRGRRPGWDQATSGPVRVQSFSGGHFYLFEHLAAVAALIRQALREGA